MPARYEIHDYRIMGAFSLQLDDEQWARRLLLALRGKGTFGRFKYTIEQLGLRDQWYAFQEEKYQQRALEWCEENGFEICEEEKHCS